MREVHTTDALSWLQQHPVTPKTSLVASLPDISEFPGKTLEEWKTWFQSTAELILSRCPEDGVVIFFQSDIRLEGDWVDKGYLCQKAAELLGFRTLWHKVVLRAPAGQATFGRPGYSHILCFSRGVKLDLAKSFGDVLPDTGEKTWVRGMGLEVCLSLARFVKEQTATETLIHVFCGEGSMLAAANHVGLAAVGVERSAKRAQKARQLQISANGKDWIEYS